LDRSLVAKNLYRFSQTKSEKNKSNIKIRMKLDEDGPFVIYNGLWGFLSPGGGSINEIFV